MTLVFDATVGGVAATSYATDTEADDYFAARLGATAWTALTTAALKQTALMAATQRLEQETYDGYKVSTSQRLKWPRYWLFDEDGFAVPSTSIPMQVKNAMFEEALWLLSNPTAQDPSGLEGFKRITVGPVTIEPVQPQVVSNLPPQVVRWLTLWRIGGGSGTFAIQRA